MSEAVKVQNFIVRPLDGRWRRLRSGRPTGLVIKSFATLISVAPRSRVTAYSKLFPVVVVKCAHSESALEASSDARKGPSSKLRDQTTKSDVSNGRVK